MSKLVNIVLLAGGLTVGYLTGQHKALDNDYRIERENGTAMLHSREIGKTYELNKVGEEVYLGDISHNLEGVRRMSFLEGKNSVYESKDTLKQESK